MNTRDQTRKRSRSRSPPPWHRQTKSPRYEGRPARANNYQKGQNQNQTRMDREERDWVAKEDDFVLKQAKRKAQIRVREGRAKPIDWLAVIVAVVDLEKDILEDDGSEGTLELADPADLIDDLGLEDLRQLSKDIEHYVVLEKHRENLRFWRAIRLLVNDRIQRLVPSANRARGVNSVSDDVARLLSPKTKEQLDVLEGQVRAKLKSDDDIDVEYWEHLLESIGIYKAKAELTLFYKNVLESRARRLKQEQGVAPEATLEELNPAPGQGIVDVSFNNHISSPDPREAAALTGMTAERQRSQVTGYVPTSLRTSAVAGSSHGSRVAAGDASQTTNAMYDREAARGVEDDEEVFAAEAELPFATNDRQWIGTYKPRKPKYFNRVQMGYEWNKYNQTHYDQDNPPPKVVQGYKFNIFYPDLIDKTKAPTYRIVREHGRKRGQSFAPAGEEDTCIIRFISGPPYEDLAFRIVDKEWDYSARRERGFKSSFDKGILQLHFQFKKVYYRK